MNFLKSLKFQLTVLLLALSCVTIGATLLIMHLSFAAAQTRSLETLDSSTRLRYDRLIKSQVQQAVSVLETAYAQAKTPLEGVELCKKLLRNMRYLDDKTGYFWADNFDGINIVHGSIPDSEGKSRLNAQDSKGNFYIRHILDVGRQPGGGFSDYLYTRDNDKTREYSKRTYTVTVPSLGWVIGTGNYIDDITSEIDTFDEQINGIYHASYFWAVLTLLFIFVVFAITFLVLNIRVLDSIRRLSYAPFDLTQIGADLTIKLPEDGPTELASAAQNYNYFVSGVRDIFKSFVDDHNEIQSTSAKLYADLEEIEKKLTDVTGFSTEFSKELSQSGGSPDAEQAINRIGSSLLAIGNDFATLKDDAKYRNNLLVAASLEIRRFRLDAQIKRTISETDNSPA